MFTEYDEKTSKYTLNILMELAEMDLDTLVKQKHMDFKEFFPVFRDSILGLTYMHMNKICHRDIKPDNIMKMGENTFVLADYGNGSNLNFIERFNENIDY